jgi:hypothetical protein
MEQWECIGVYFYLQALLSPSEPISSATNACSSSEITITLPPGFQDHSGGNVSWEEDSNSHSRVVIVEKTPVFITPTSSESNDIVKVSMSGYVVAVNSSVTSTLYGKIPHSVLHCVLPSTNVQK